MSIFTDKGIVQKIVIATVFVILFNFIVPNISFAKGDDEKTAGGILFEPIKDLLLVVADGVISITQSMLLGMDNSFLTLEHQKSNASTITGWVVRYRCSTTGGRFNYSRTCYWWCNMGSFRCCNRKSSCCRNCNLRSCKSCNYVYNFKNVAKKARFANI